MRSRRLTWALTRLLIVVPLTLLGLVLLLLGFALSPWGTGFLLSQGQRLGLLEVGEVQGALLDTLILKDFHLGAGPATIDLGYLELAWADDCLLSGKLCIDRLAVEGAYIRLGEGDDTPKPESEPGGPISLPFPIELRELALNDVELLLADGTRIHWEAFSSGAMAEQNQARLLSTRLAGLTVRLPLTAGQQLALSEAEQQGPALTAEAIDAAIAARSPLPAAVAAEAEGARQVDLADRPRIELPEIELPLAIDVPSLVIENAELLGGSDSSRLYGIDRLELAVNASGQTIVIKPLTLASREADASLEGNITLSGDYPLDLALTSELYLPERFPALNGEHIDLRLGGNLAALDVQLALDGPVQARLDAELDALAPTLPFQARLTSPELQWPLPGMAVSETEAADSETVDSKAPETAADAEPWQVQDLALNVEGSLLDYALRLTLAAQGPGLPPTNVALTGSGDLQHFSWAPLHVEMEAGSLASQGRIGWEEALDVSATLDLDDFDPSAFVDDLDGRLSGEAELSFHQDADGWQVTVPGVSIDGTLKSYPLSLEAKLAGDSSMNWQIDTLDFYQGENHLNAAGSVSPEKMDIAANINMPALNTLYPELRGSLRGEIDVAGTLEAPQLDIDLAGSELGMGDNQLATLSLKGKVAGLEDPSLDIALLAQNIIGGGQHLDEISLNLNGKLSDHQLDVGIDGQGDGPLAQLTLALEGGLDNKRERYAGRLAQLDAQTPYGSFGLSEDMVFAANLTEGSAQVEPFCLQRAEGGAVCLVEPLLASGDKGNANLVIRELPMDLADAALPPGWSISGATEGTVSAQWSAGGSRWEAQAKLDSSAEITGEDAYGQPWTVPGTELTLQLEADQGQVDADVALSLGESGGLRLALGIADPMGAGRLDGTLTLDDIRLAPYRPLASGVDTLKGRLTGEVRISGDRNNPVMTGNISLDALEAAGQDLPLDVRDGQLDIALNGDRADIQGYVASQKGRLNISGDARWPSADDWQIALALEARDEPLQAGLPGFGQLRLAPDLTVRVTPERLRVRGEVRIPWSRLEVGKVPPSAVSPSSDEVIITEDEDREARLREELAARGESTAEAMKKVGMIMDIRISLLLGPDMQLSAYGLETELVGELEVRQKNGPLQLFGEVELKDGRFRAFGQDLIIREGILYFSGPPGEPLLDFEAIRNPANTEDGVIAGLKVSGTASSPSLDIFSEPPLDEASALSYVLRGRAPGDSGNASGALTSALIGVTLGQAGGSVGALGEAFGIQDLSLDTAGSGEDSQVVVTGDLSDRLSIGYGVGVFSPIAELSLRYKIWRNLYAEAISGASQAVDLIYTYSLPGDPPKLQ